MGSNATHDRLENAATTDEVVDAVRQYVLDLSSKGLDRLPRYNRPVGIDSAEGIGRWAEQLARYEQPLSQDPVNSALFIEVRDYFVRASERVADLSH